VVDQVVDIFLIIKVNAIGLQGSNSATGGGTGLGLFAGACLFNHSCLENVSHVYLTPENGGNNELVLHAVATQIDSGTEVAFSYLDDLYQCTQARQESLAKTKFFSCSCGRCTDPTEVGRYVRAAVCTACRNRQSNKGSGKTKAREATVATEVGYLNPLPLPGNVWEEFQSKTEEEKQKIKQSTDWRCSVCQKTYPANGTTAKELYNKEKEIQTSIDQALYMLQLSQLMVPVVHDSGPEDFKRAISVLEDVLKKRSSDWHPNHHLLFLAKLNLIGCYLQPGLNDLRRSLELSEQVCQSAEDIFPANSVTKAELLGDKANILQRIVLSTKSTALQKRQREKGREILNTALGYLRACRGNQHRLVRDLLETMQSYGKA